MPTDPIDFEKYAQTLQQTMAGAIAEAEALNTRAATDREAIADVQVTIQEKLNALDHRARQTATTYEAKHRDQLKNNIREDVLALVAAKLLNSGETPAAIAALLDVSEDFLGRARKR